MVHKHHGNKVLVAYISVCGFFVLVHPVAFTVDSIQRVWNEIIVHSFLELISCSFLFVVNRKNMTWLQNAFFSLLMGSVRRAPSAQSL